MTVRFPIALAALLLTAACTKPADTTLAATGAGAEYTSSGTVGSTSSATVGSTSRVDSTVQVAVAVSQALHRFPAKGDSVLTAFHLTTTEFAALMKRIAQDSTLSADYRRLTQ